MSLFSPWHSYRLFQRYTGLTVAEYLRRLRLSRSAMRLKNENCRVVDAAYQLGFGSVDGYQRAFHREFGCHICGCGFPNSAHNFEPAVAQFKLMFRGSHTIITVPESPMFNAPEAAVVTVPRLELVREAGRQYAKTGTIDAGLLAQIGSPMIPEEVYANIVNGEA